MLAPVEQHSIATAAVVIHWSVKVLVSLMQLATRADGLFQRKMSTKEGMLDCQCVLGMRANDLDHGEDAPVT